MIILTDHGKHNDYIFYIAKYLAGEFSAEEKEAFEKKLNASVDLQSEFSKYQSIWDRSTSESIDVDKAWNKFRYSVDMHSRTHVLRRTLLGIAASLIILLGISVILKLSSDSVRNFNKQVASNTNQHKNITLSDGSSVTLNHDSQLLFHDDYSNTDTRTVRLVKGEAFFNVARDTEKPFTVMVDTVVISVLGTSFNIEKTEKHIILSVNTGRVQITSKANGKSDVLKKGQCVCYNSTDHSLSTVESVSPNTFAWYNKKIIFNNTSLQEAVSTINSIYFTNISLANTEMGEYLVNAEFEDKSAETIIKVLAATFDLHIANSDDNQIILSE